MNEYEKKLDEQNKARAIGQGSIFNLIALAISPISFPLALGFMVYDIYDATKENIDEQKKAVPDSWLEKVSKDESVSDEGLKFLAKKLESQGYVSIKDAYEWIQLEERLALKKIEEMNKKENLNKNGALNLLNRVKNIQDTNISFDKALEQINKVKEKFDFVKEIDLKDKLTNIGSFFKNKVQ